MRREYKVFAISLLLLALGCASSQGTSVGGTDLPSGGDRVVHEDIEHRHDAEIVPDTVRDFASEVVCLPSGEEVCDDIDNDCDGLTDEDLVSNDTGWCKNQGVCAAESAKVRKVCVGGVWICDYSLVPNYEGDEEHSCDELDNDCDGETDEDFVYSDEVHPTPVKKGYACGSAECAYGRVVCSEDQKGLVCSFQEPLDHELCDGLDNDCDGFVDEDFYYDGVLMFIDPSNPDAGRNGCRGIGECGNTVGVIECAGLYNTTCSTMPNGSESLAKPEECNNLDDDCDGETDEEGADGCVYYYVDADRDGYGDEATKKCLCAETDPYGLMVGGDCDDTNPQINPAVNEICETGVDENCNGSTDEAGCQECSLYYKDNDADGYGVTGDFRCLREAIVPYTAIRGGDCDDADATANPGMDEACNGKDDNCNSLTDEEKKGGECGTHGYMLFYYDGDDDTYGDERQPKCLCAPWGKYKTQRAYDCDDSDAEVNPSMPEICGNNKDDNCNGSDNEKNAIGCARYFYDFDGDGFGSPESECYCAPFEYYTASDASDCDDTNSNINPAQTEVCQNGEDDDCDGIIDENQENAVGCRTYFFDFDSDGYGTSLSSKCLCAPSEYYTALVATDCDDMDASVNPGKTEVCNNQKDDDCDGATDENQENAVNCTFFYMDYDGDGFGTQAKKCYCEAFDLYRATMSGDCMDRDATVNPGAVEKCNGKDDNCDGYTDEERTSDVCGTDAYAKYYYDGDNDTYGVTHDWKCLCAPFDGYKALRGDDCDDTDSLVHPGTLEICGNSKDDNCDGTQNEKDAVNCTVFYFDFDGDGYGIDDSACYCETYQYYRATRRGDCQDTDPTVSPGKTEVCNNTKDDDCDGATDENQENATNCTNYYLDADRDGWGRDTYKCLCAPQGDYIATMGGDCYDTNPMVNPGVPEKCNNVDDNCNGETDEESASGVCGSYGYKLYYRDHDLDTYGLSDDKKCLCSPRGEYTASQPGDCDDNDPLVNPGALEICRNGKDDNCDGTQNSENAVGCSAFFYDEDGDGFGTEANKCFCEPSGLYRAATSGDCQDKDSDVNPSQNEVCNNQKDDDCDGTIDQKENAVGCTDYYLDLDADGWGINQKKCYCSPYADYRATRITDCNDNDAQINPGITERCADSMDNDCDGLTDENQENADGCTIFYYDNDNDGYGTNTWKCFCAPSLYYRARCSGDCDDQDPATHPGGDCGPSGMVCGKDGDCDNSPADVGEMCDDGTPNLPLWDGCTYCSIVDIQVNTYTTDWQGGPSIASLSDGGFVVVWYSWQQDGSDYGVYGQRFNSNGFKVGSEFRVNTYTTGYQGVPSVAPLQNGGFVVVWQSGCGYSGCNGQQDGYYYGVYGQRYDSSGAKLGSEFRVNTWTTESQTNPRVTSLVNGGFVVVWVSYSQDGSHNGVYGQLYDDNGNKLTQEFRVNTYTTGNQEMPSIASLPNGGFVVVWESYGQDGSNDGIYVQRFDGGGNKIGQEVRVNSYTTSDQTLPAVAALPDSGFVVVWQSSGQDGSNDGIYGQIFGADGNPVGSEFRVNTWSTDAQQRPAITTLGNGKIIVVWESYLQDGSSDGIYAQIFSADGTRVGSEFRVNTYTTNDQWRPQVMYSRSQGKYVVVWSSSNQDGSSGGIFARILQE